MKSMQFKKGFSLIEILLVIGFIAAAIAAVFVVYPKVQSSNQANAEAQNLSTISAGTKSLFVSQSSYAGLSAAVLICAKVVPDSMINSTPAVACGATPAGALVNVWGGAVTVGPVAFNGGTNNAIQISYAGVPTEPCVKLSNQAGANFNKVTINAVVVKDTSANTAFSTTAAVTNCAAANAVTILFTTI